VLDGATPRAEVESGCVHTVPWVVQRLGISLTRSITLNPDIPLADALAEAIRATCAEHADTCDLTNPDSPSSTVVMLRKRASVLEWLILGDSPLLLDGPDGLQVLTDDRSAHLPSYTPEGVRAARNQPGGFWIASTVPEAAHHAVTGSAAAADIRHAALLSDGASRWVDRLSLGGWHELFKLLTASGPAEVIRQVRAAERAQLEALSYEPSGRMVKRHDDATAVLVQCLTEEEAR
jgi:hypothetical protein